MYAVLLMTRSGHLFTTGDRHQQTHALAYKQTREVGWKKKIKKKRKDGRTQYQGLFTVATITAHPPLPPPPLPPFHRHTSSRSHQAKCICQRRSGPDGENTFPEISVTYICEGTCSEAHTHAHTLFILAVDS